MAVPSGLARSPEPPLQRSQGVLSRCRSSSSSSGGCSGGSAGSRGGGAAARRRDGDGSAPAGCAAAGTRSGLAVRLPAWGPARQQHAVPGARAAHGHGVPPCNPQWPAGQGVGGRVGSACFVQRSQRAAKEGLRRQRHAGPGECGSERFCSGRSRGGQQGCVRAQMVWQRGVLARGLACMLDRCAQAACSLHAAEQA